MNLYDGLAHWYGLGDCCGTLHDASAAIPIIDGGYSNGAGIGQGAAGPAPIRCVIDELSYAQGGWARSGLTGGTVPYPGGVSFYDPANFTLAFFWENLTFTDPHCPGLVTDFPVTPYGVGNYFPGDAVSSGGHPYMSTATFVSDGSLPPASDPARWRHMDSWYACYRDMTPYYTFGLIGDHSGFPFNAGWGIITEFDHAATTSPSGVNPDGIFGEWRLTFKCESPTTPDINISAGYVPSPPQWMMTVVWCDGAQLRIYTAAVGDPIGIVGVAPAADFVTSQAGLGFGYYDNNKALSGKHELWQGFIDECIIWDRPLDYAEIVQIPTLWCERRYALHSAHRAVPNANLGASKLDAALHLSGIKHRADPQAVPSSGSGAPLVDLSGGSFRARL